MTNRGKRAMKEKLSRARQRVHWSTGTVEWVLFEHVYQEVMSRWPADASSKDIQQEAREIWDTQCFDRTIYHVGGEHMTKAEAFEAWCGQGLNWRQCMQRFALEAVQTQEAQREVDADFQQSLLAR